MRLVSSFLILLLRAYQAAFRPFFGPVCRFEPSCSRYAEDALRFHGPIHGTRLAVLRVCRCHPFSAGGFDPVPDTAGQASAAAATSAARVTL